MNADSTADGLPPTLVARLATDEWTARRLIELIGENDAPGEVAASAHESPGGWILEAYFTAATDRDRLRDLIAQAAGPAAAVTFETISATDWVKASFEALPPVRAGRFVMHGAHTRAGIAPNDFAIEIEAGLAFGTGHHGTTRGCLLALENWAKRPRRPRTKIPLAARGKTIKIQNRRILDLGTGSGILAIAAVKALHQPVLASDIDTNALRVARGNARRNRAGALVEFLHAGKLCARRYRECAPYQLILANILAQPLLRMAASLAPLLAPDGALVLSGLLPEQANAIISAYGAQGLRLARRKLLEGWLTLVFRRTGRPRR